MKLLQKTGDRTRRFPPRPGPLLLGRHRHYHDGPGRPPRRPHRQCFHVGLPQSTAVLVCVAHDAHSYPALAAASHFAVNILAGHHETVSSRFATKPAAHPSEKFEGVDFRQSALGLPVLKDSLAELECATVHAYPAGDHTILVGRVEAAESRGDAGFEPLLYYRGKYRRLHNPASKT